MKNYLSHHPWKIIEDQFHPDFNQVSESIFSLGNGRFGGRGNFEEGYGGQTLLGNYVGGVYYPDKTRVGWWKNGYPEYFAKVLNAPNWLPVEITVGDIKLDLATAEILDFKRTLDMQHGILEREYRVKLANNAIVHAKWKRFISMANDELAVICLEFKIENFVGTCSIKSFIDGDIRNEDANYDEFFWEEMGAEQIDKHSILQMKTRKTGFVVTTGQSLSVKKNTEIILPTYFKTVHHQIGAEFEFELKDGDSFRLEKKVSVVSSLMHDPMDHFVVIQKKLDFAESEGVRKLEDAHSSAWKEKWEWSDVVIQGDVAAQQGIRFNIFQLNQTYTGEDERLNIGPKGFTGEKYGGSTYWDTEAYCLPYYLSTADSHVGKNLVRYRFNHLQKAIENAEKLGFKNGAALYPMVTMNGEECHNEWEITFEEIHRNGAIAHAVYDYVKYSGDLNYLGTHGLEVLIGIARFWAQRFTWSAAKKKYVMLGVTGPNEYENNVNNNWYTIYIARWCLKYTREVLQKVEANQPDDYSRIIQKTNFNILTESEKWNDIIEKVYLPYNKERDIYLQQDGFLDKELVPVSELNPAQTPLVEHWSWDRILRSVYIKQADVLQGMYFFEDDFDTETIKRHYDFYEPFTVHESSLSACVHSIIAAKIGDFDRAYQFYLQTARLDLDDYNNDTLDGLHITSMAGTWLSVVQGFGGLRIGDDKLVLNPFLPKEWDAYSFNIVYRETRMEIAIDKNGVKVLHIAGPECKLMINGKDYNLVKSLTIDV